MASGVRAEGLPGQFRVLAAFWGLGCFRVYRFMGFIVVLEDCSLKMRGFIWLLLRDLGKLKTIEAQFLAKQLSASYKIAIRTSP